MLTRVLLHVVEATRPIDNSFDLVILRFAGQDVSNCVALIDNIEYVDATHRAAVRRLPTRVGIKRSAIQINSKALVFRLRFKYARLKFTQVAIGVVETLSLPGVSRDHAVYSRRYTGNSGFPPCTVRLTTPSPQPNLSRHDLAFRSQPSRVGRPARRCDSW